MNDNPKRYEVVETSTTKLWLREDGILQTESFPESKLTLTDGKELTKVHHQLINGEPRLLLCDISKIKRISAECRKHFSGKEHGETFTACALVIGSLTSAIIGNIFMTIDRPAKPTRLYLQIKMKH